MYSPTTTSQPTDFPATRTPSLSTSTITPTDLPTRAQLPTVAPSPTRTPVTIPVSTFIPALALTRTPMVPAECPLSTNYGKLPNFEGIKKSEDFEKAILEVLNEGGVEQLLKAAKAERFGSYHFNRDLFYQDLTGDDVPEIVVQFQDNFKNIYVFGCDQRAYKILLTEKRLFDYAPTILAIRDLNMNGVADLAIEHMTCHYCSGIRVYEWDGQQFQSMVRTWYVDDSELAYSDIAELKGYTSTSISDTDQNGTFELVLIGGTPSYLGGIAGGDGPYRAQTVVFMWDGQFYTFYSREFEPPNFRFEAIQDGDDASLAGKYEQAFAFYQDAIFSDHLKSWTRETWYQLVRQNTKIALPDISQMPYNKTEYDQLASYAHYRIMLLHLLHGKKSDAQLIFETLQKKFSQGSAGYPYVELATIFWNEYQSSDQIGEACEKAVAYVNSHKDLIEPLGGQGLSSKWYTTEDLCPFK